jgi:hypothetical protein
MECSPRAGHNLFGRRRGLISQDGVAMHALVLLRVSVTSSIASNYPPADLPDECL